MHPSLPTIGRCLLWFGLLFVSVLGSCTPQAVPAISLPPVSPPVDTFPHGVASGDVDQTSAVLWARSTATGPITFTVEGSNAEAQVLKAEIIDPAVPITVTATRLAPNRQYTYRVTNAAGARLDGRFRTPAEPGNRVGLRFGAGGDWLGDMAPYTAMSNAAGRDLDFFLHLGDAIYADIPSPAEPQGPARTLDEFRSKYAEVYAIGEVQHSWAALRASTSLYLTIDDHEVLNNFAGGAEAARDSRFPEEAGLINDTALYENALQALLEYHPLRAEFYGYVDSERIDGERKLYRYRTFGSEAALIVTDSRSFRDLPLAGPDRHDDEAVARFRQATFHTDRTILGAKQLADLKADLLDARRQGFTWIFVAVSVPIQNMGLIAAQERFEGYAAERAELLRFIDEEEICNVVFISAEIHGTLVNDIFYRLTQEAPDQPTGAFEITVSPAAIYPSLGEVIVIHGLEEDYVSEEEAAVYRSLPVANDPDDEIDDRDDWVKAKINEELAATGYNLLGLGDSIIDAQLVAGDWVAVEYFGWTEFAIDAGSGSLTVTTYGIPPYTKRMLAENLEQILARQPQVVSEFVVQPARCQG